MIHALASRPEQSSSPRSPSANSSKSKRLALNTRLVDIVDLGFAQYDPGITIRHLLTHTSGIPDYYDEENVKDFDGFTVSVPWSELKGPRDYLAVFPDEPMKFAPGERFSYSNGGFIVLGIVIEELTGLAYQRFVETELLGPAGMDRSGFFAMNRLPEQTALGYVEDQVGWRTNIFDLPIVGASDGGVFTTLDDLAKLWRAFWSNEILSHELVTIMTTPFVRAEAEGEHIYYGHGTWIHDDGSGTREVYIEGCDAGVSFRSGTNRAEAFEYTVISNTTGGAWPLLKVIDTASRLT